MGSIDHIPVGANYLKIAEHWNLRGRRVLKIFCSGNARLMRGFVRVEDERITHICTIYV
jgi:hypothetical protein